MTGTPSRTATAPDGGSTRHSDGTNRSPCAVRSPRGGVGRKLEAKLWPEEHEPHRGGRLGGQRRSVARSPMSSGPAVVDAAGGWSEGRASYPGRSACLPLGHQYEQAAEGEPNQSSRLPEGARPSGKSEEACNVLRTRAREAERSTMGRQKSADAKVAAAHGGERAEQEMPNRHKAFDA